MLNLSTSLEILKLQVQNYSCKGCSNCSQLTNYDLRSKQGILNWLITKRTCYLTKLETKINQLETKKEEVKKEIKEYKETLEKLNISNEG